MRLLTPILLLAAFAAPQATPPAPAPWHLTWSDEFNGPNHSAPDPAKWIYDIGGDGWLNHELETYTSRPENVRIEDGHLVLEARREDLTGPDGIPRHYTSGRIKTLGRFAQQYGRFEARIQIPRGQGIWPAFWMEGVSLPTAGWPGCGEIDVMENIGRDPGRVYSTLHGPGYTATSPLQARFNLPPGQALADSFHIYAVEWSRTTITFSFDGVPFGHIERDSPAHGRDLPLDQPFFLLLNLAIGGDWPGPPNDQTLFPQRMLVDYVRVYGHP